MPEDAQDLVDRGASPENEGVARQQKDMVRGVLNELPETDRRM